MSKYKKSKFFVRLLPTEDVDWENIKIENNKEVIHIRCLQDFNRLSHPTFKGKDNRPRFWSFQTDGIFYSTCQETIYDVVMDGVISSVYQGVNIVVMALGQTCSGKSFTMGALRRMYEYRGIVPRFLSAIFSDIESKTKEWKVQVGVSFIEIMGNTVYDLLSKTPASPSDVKNVSIVNVKNEEHALALFFKGESRRRTTSEAPYLGANCATGITTFKFECQSLIRSNAFVNRTEVHFIDLAGVETVGKRSLTSFKSSADQGAANQAKYNVEQVLVHMGKDYHSDQQIKKTCKLIEYLHSSLLRGCILRFIGHIRPTHPDLEVSLSTLKFGLKVKHVATVPITHYTEPNAELMFENIKEELNQLKEQMLVEKLLSESHEVESGNFSQARLKHLERLANAYLQGWSSELNVLGNTEHLIILKMFKHLFSKKNEELDSYQKEVKRLSLPDIETRFSKSSRQSKRSKDDVEQGGKNQRKRSLKDMRKIGSKSGATIGRVPPVQSTSSVIIPEKESTTETSFELKHDNVLFSFQESIAPDLSEKKIWEEFLLEQRIDPKYLEVLAELLKKKKMAFELSTNDYNETRLNLERNRLALKEIAWKRHSGKNELYDRFGQVVVSQEERSTAKLVSTLQGVEKDMKKSLESKYLEWKEASKDFLQEKCKIEEKFKEYCTTKYHMPFTPPVAFENPRGVSEVDDQSETSRRDYLSKYYNFLQKKLFEKEMKKHKRHPMQRK